MDQSVDQVPIGRLPALGVVPKRMHAWVIRSERHGTPAHAFRKELVEVPTPGPGEVLVKVMAAGINYNGIWAASGKPVSVFGIHKHEFHIAGSDASGVVWKTGPGVTKCKVGDEVVIHCNVTCGECCSCNGFDPMTCEDQRIWGFETPYGSFAQFALVQSQQVLPKPKDLTWEIAASYGLVCFTAYRMLASRGKVQPGENVLIWGASGGLGCFAVQITKLLGGNPIAVVSSKRKGGLAVDLGAIGYIDRLEFPGLAYRPSETPEERATRVEQTKRFGRAIWEVIGERKSPDVVFEHVGQETFPTSVFLAGRMGRIVICGATSGYQLSFDVRHLWMRQKMIVGSHFAHAGECERANDLVRRGKIRPVLTDLYTYEGIPDAHQAMVENRHTGTLACLVGAPHAGLRSLEETLAVTTADLRVSTVRG